ncbi:MAG: hypothetical protein Q7U89_03925 [Coriobacteriia bacterium]|nr:hypothetical protein [Coriobacteriia bacterium]
MRLVRLYRTEGEGRTQSGLPRATAFSRPGLAFAVWAIVVLATSLRFVMDTASVGRFDASAVVGVSAILSGALVAAVHWPSRSRSASGHRTPMTSMLLMTIASGLAQAGLPLLVFANRHSDAPPGSVVAFWTTAFVGVALVCFGAVRGRDRLLRLTAALLLLVSMAGVLANWERPSSFSLLVRYTGPQVYMAFAALAWVALLSYLAARVERLGWAASALPIAIGSGVAGAVLLIGSTPGLSALLSPIILLSAGASAVLYLMVLSVAPGRGALIAGTAIAAAPAAITLLTILESAVGVLGPRPILVAPVLAASAVGACAIAIALVDSSRKRVVPPGRLALGLSLAAVLAATGGLIAPALGVAVRGGLSNGEVFAADFTMAGFETVAGWLAFTMALIVLISVRSGLGRWRAVGILGALVVLAMAWTVLQPMPLHTWVTWIPPEVQQDYGTEFASIVFTPLSSAWQLIGLSLSALAAGLGAWSVWLLPEAVDAALVPVSEGRS